jgi:hypothetical protein
MSRVVERQLITRAPRKNHDCEVDAEDTVKGEQPLRFRDPNSRHAFHFSYLTFYGIAPGILIGGCRNWLLLIWRRHVHFAATI